MAKYIPLDALVAEIEKLKDGAHNGVSFNKSRQSMGLKNELSTWEHLENAFATVLKIINTLEVKEVDIDKLCEFRKNIGFAYPEGASEYQKQLACYRQGIKDVIKAQKGEKV